MDAGPIVDASIPDTGPVPGLAEIVFPSANALTNASALTVRGKGSESISLVWVNGVPATSEDGFQSWQAKVDLREESILQPIVVEVQTPTGKQLAQEYSIRRHLAVVSMFSSVQTTNEPDRLSVAGFESIAELSPDPLKARVRWPGITQDRVYIFDMGQRGSNYWISTNRNLKEIVPGVGIGREIRSVGPPNGMAVSSRGIYSLKRESGGSSLWVSRENSQFMELSGPSQGTGPALPSTTHAVAIDAQEGFAYCLGQIPSSIVRVELSSGNRSSINWDYGQFGTPWKIAFNKTNGQAFVLGSRANALRVVRTNLQFDKIELLTDFNLEVPNSLGANDYQLLYGPGEQLYLVDKKKSRIYTINPSSGATQLWMDDQVGSGPWIHVGAALAALSGAPNELLVIGTGLWTVDPRSGLRTRLSSNLTYGVRNPIGLVRYPEEQVAYTISSFGANHGFWKLDLGLQTRTQLFGSGPALERVVGLEKMENGRMLTFDMRRNELLTIDKDGNRQALPSTGDSLPVTVANALSYDSSQKKPYLAAHNLNGIVEIDLTTGSRVRFELLTAHQIRSMVSHEGDIYYATYSPRQIVRFRPSDQSTEIISSLDVGSGPRPPVNVKSLALDVERGQLLLLNSLSPSLVMAIDLKSKERIYLSR